MCRVGEGSSLHISLFLFPISILSISGGGFGWDVDFSLIPVKSPVLSSMTSEAAEDSLPRLSPALVSAQKQVLPIQFSRFTVSPAAVSRFSITHVTDSDVEPVGGKVHFDITKTAEESGLNKEW